MKKVAGCRVMSHHEIQLASDDEVDDDEETSSSADEIEYGAPRDRPRRCEVCSEPEVVEVAVAEETAEFRYK